MSYCLVCLASGTKDPCVRCGHRPSKRMEQLVHLRLKSIYKAFKQSGAALSGKGGNGNGNGSHNGNDNHNANNSANNSNNHHGEGRRNNSSDNGHHIRSRRGDSNHSSSETSNRNMPTWMAKKAGSSSSVSMPLPASVQRYAEMHGKDLKKRPGNVNGRQNSLKGDVGAVLQVAAAAASASAAASSSSSFDGNSKHRKGKKDYFSDCSTKFNDSDFTGVPGGGGGGRNQSRNKTSSDSDRYAARTQAEADAAAAALLAELDEEKMQTEASSKAKKSKKKKKKQRQAAKEKEKEVIRLKEEEKLRLKEDTEITDSKKEHSVTDKKSDAVSKKIGISKKKKKKDQDSPKNNSSPLNIDRHTFPLDESNDNDSEDDYISRFTDVKNHSTNNNETSNDKDKTEKLLADLVSANDLLGIEKLLAELKGVPGRAALRKNAKKAVKRIKEEQATNATKLQKEQLQNYSNNSVTHANDVGNSVDEIHTPYRAPEPLLKVVSRNNRIAAPGQPSRYECVMHMAPSVVGWVIGKGGQESQEKGRWRGRGCNGL